MFYSKGVCGGGGGQRGQRSVSQTRRTGANRLQAANCVELHQSVNITLIIISVLCDVFLQQSPTLTELHQLVLHSSLQRNCLVITSTSIDAECSL